MKVKIHSVPCIMSAKRDKQGLCGMALLAQGGKVRNFAIRAQIFKQRKKKKRENFFSIRIYFFFYTFLLNLFNYISIRNRRAL